MCFAACPAEMLPTLRLQTGRLPILTGSVLVRSVMFMTDQFVFKYGQFIFTDCLAVESWN